jgi:hypothetical protein
MATGSFFKNDSWRIDSKLGEEMRDFVKQGIQRKFF